MNLQGKTVSICNDAGSADKYLRANLESFGMVWSEDASGEFLVVPVASCNWSSIPEESEERPIVVGWIDGLSNNALDDLLAYGFDSLMFRSTSLSEQRASLIVGMQHRAQHARLRDRLEKVTEQLRSASAIEKAKLILSQNKGLSELEAYKLLREQSMKQRISVAALAQSILESHELFS